MSKISLYAIFWLMIFSWFSATETAAQEACKPPAITANTNAFNIFNDQQEMYLGDAVAERVRRNYRVIDDEQVNAHLQKLGDRIISHLPPTNLKFQFLVVDLPEANAFNMAGGRVYVTRKLLAFVRNEDELAGVLAHELGHGIVHHTAIDMSKSFKEILGVTQVGDRRDVFEKYNLLIDKRRTKKVTTSNNHEDNQQLEADRIGLFAAMAAGYDPNGLITFLDRLTESKGKTGNFFSDFFGATKPAQKRLREMIGALKSVPASCLDKRTAANAEEFEKWRAYVIAYSGLGGKERLNGLVSRKTLAPPLRSDVTHLRFSPNGEYILAQDDSGINVLKREPFSLQFRIEAADVKNANFTPDSKHVVFYNTGLRVEKWSVAEKSLVSVHELVLRRGCWQTALSPDGKTLSCYNYWGDLGLYDVATNENIFLEKQFYLPNRFEYFTWQLARLFGGDDEIEPMNMQFSPDAKYFVAGHRTSSSVSKSLGGGINFAILRESIGIDVAARKKIELGDNVKKMMSAVFTFYAPDKLLGQYDNKGQDSGIISFPKGDQLETIELRARTYTKAELGDYVLVRPVSSAPVGVFDLKAKKYVLANKTSALDVYGDYFVSERKNGELGLYKFQKGEKTSIESSAVLELPTNQFGALRTVGLSPDGKWLAASEKSRGGVWNLETGERVLYLRGFRGSHFGDNNLIYADFPKNELTGRTLASMNPMTGAVDAVAQLSDNTMRQYGQFLVSFKSNKESDKKEESKREKEKEEKALPFDEERSGFIGLNNVTMEVRDSQSNAVLWERNFEYERPRYGFNRRHGTLTLIWSLQTKAANAIIKANPALSEKLAAMQEKEGDYLIQILDPKNGAIKGQFLLETGEGSFSIDDVSAAGDNLVISDSTNRVLIYSIAKNELRHRYFGNYPTINPAGDLIAIENEPGQMAVYDLKTGLGVEKLYFGKPVSFAQFSADGKRLFVLTANQTAFFIDAAQLALQASNSVK